VINALTVHVEFGRFDFSGYPTLHKLDCISSLESMNRSGQVSGTSDASKTQSGLDRAVRRLWHHGRLKFKRRKLSLSTAYSSSLTSAKTRRRGKASFAAPCSAKASSPILRFSAHSVIFLPAHTLRNQIETGILSVPHVPILERPCNCRAPYSTAITLKRSYANTLDISPYSSILMPRVR
jgi:hypothetical protein